MICSIDRGGASVYTSSIGRCTMQTESEKKSRAKYDAANTVQFKMKLNKKTDADILAKLEQSGNKQGYIKALIRADIEK